MARMTTKLFQMSDDVLENFHFEVAEELGIAPEVKSEKWSCISQSDFKDETVKVRNSF
ncbi:hypothetical protein [Desulfuribacillus alkaliarsenatis]|uniref:hypothetical protein n=1 Tax=Desulfuribacillus alkaliarsenatis TaxID=766136 RepID=UPI0015B4EB4A|nr:hypothetical protein [Desulfuribacillus alkaliarsenatis]